MPSHLRQHTTVDPISVAATQSLHPYQRPQKKQKMTITQTYSLAHTARGKLSSEASRGDHDLRLLVGHANLLDSLMVELQDAERDQEAWFNRTVRSAQPTSSEPKRVQWQDTIEEEFELPDASDSDSEYEDEEEEELEQAPAIPLRRLRSPPAASETIYAEDVEDEFEDDDEDNHLLTLTRTVSHSAAVEPEPELIHDTSDSEEDSPPNSPPTTNLAYADPSITARDFGLAPDTCRAGLDQTLPDIVDEDLFMREQQPQLVAAY